MSHQYQIDTFLNTWAPKMVDMMMKANDYFIIINIIQIIIMHIVIYLS